MSYLGLANAARATTEFRFLNNARPVIIGESSDGGLAYRNFIAFLRRSRPNESTPLCKQIEEVTKKISEIESHLRTTNRRAAVIICSDGETSDGDIVKVFEHIVFDPSNDFF